MANTLTKNDVQSNLLIKNDHSVFKNLSLRQHLGMAVANAWNRPFYRQFWPFESKEEAVNAVFDGAFTSFPIIRKSHLRSDFDDIIDFTNSIDVVSSSGTTGRPVDMPIHYNQEKGRILRVRRILRSIGLQSGDRVLQLLSLNDLFTLGVLSWQAIKEEGATAIRCTSTRLDRVLDALKYNKPNFVIANPYVMVKLANEAGDRWPSPDELPDNAFFAVAATFKPDLSLTSVAKKAIELWGLKNHKNQYGTSEVGPIGYELNNNEGFTIHSDFHHLELVNPITNQPVSDGEPGEVVITCLSYERGFLPIRYATGDMAAWLKTIVAPDGSVRTLMGPIIGRTDHQMKIYGQTVFPNLLLGIADAIEGVQKSIITVVRTPLEGDNVNIVCVVKDGFNPDEVKLQVKEKCTCKLAMSPEVKITDISYINNLVDKVSANTNKSKIPRFFILQNTFEQA